MTRSLFLGVLAVTLAAAPASAAFTITVDDFEAGPLNLVQTGVGTNTSVQGGLPNANVLGGERETVLQVFTSDFGLSTQVNVLTGPGLLAVSNDAGNDSRVTQTYDGAGSAGLGGVDLTVGGGSFFQFDVVSSDLGVTVTVNVEDTLGNTGSLTYAIPGPGILNFAFTSFSGSVDFTTVDSIQVVYNAPVDADYVIEFFGVGTAVPEPASVVMAVMGATAVGGFARRRLAQKA